MIDPVKRQKEAKRLKKQGLTVREIARKLNSSLGAISQDIYGPKKKSHSPRYRNGMLPQPPPKAPEGKLPKYDKQTQLANRRLVVQLRARGLTFVEIAKQLGVSSEAASHLYYRWLGRV